MRKRWKKMMDNFKEYSEFVEKHIMDFIPSIDSKSETLYDAVKYSVSNGGKRVRPVLLLVACDFAGGDIKKALPYACALEYIHTYSLIHDDLPAMDDDDLRRGKPSNHKVFGEGMAILAGDALLNTAYEVMQRDMIYYFDTPECLKCRINAGLTIAKGSGLRGMIAGQSSDIENENKACSKEMLDYIHVNKTGALIVAAIRAGLYLAGADDVTFEKLTAFAENYGLAYQISDDILDVVGNVEELGKMTNMDSERGKNSYVTLHGLDAAYEKLDELINKAIEPIACYYDNAEIFRDLALSLKDRTK